MDCRSCGVALTPGARFCASCGAPVVATCASCDAKLPDGARFCPACGAAAAHAPAPGALVVDGSNEAPRIRLASSRDPGRERKIATLLFADIVGFTGLSERHDPELVSARTAALFERLSREVERYEGTIEKFAGDAMLAVFGVPTAHEDDPERAVRAALEMQAAAGSAASAGSADGTGADAAAGPDLALRIGIETGEVLVDRTRAATVRDLFVTGDAVNTAARLQGIAEPGTVVVGPSTYAATRDVVEYEELRPVALKGKTSPVAAWRAEAIKAGRGGRRSRLGLEAPLVGREAELALLKDTVRRAADEGRPHMVTVVGSAGVGKSRLAWELEKYLDGLPDLYHWRKGRCLAYSSPSFGPVADVVKVDARIQDDDGPGPARDKLATRLAELPLAADESSVRDALEAVLAIGDGRDRSRDELFEAWRRYLGAIAAVAPLVLVVEDIHWADDSMLSFLDFIARWAEGPIVILCLARHELLERRGGWGGGLPNAATIVLEPLGDAASTALVDGLLDGGVPAELGARITALAEGNPLFVEEMVRMLVDRGILRYADGHWELAGAVDEVAVPDSVQAVLAARLDALPAEEKRVAQDAAVIGRIFWDVVVAHLTRTELGPTDQLIRRLRIKDLVVPRSPSSLAEASEFGFRHVLIRDVAYDSLPKRDRSRLHRDIALWAEAELADRIEEFSELIASHLAAALAYEEEFAEGDSDDLRQVRELARSAALRAARRARSMSQFDAAGRWLRLALDLSRKLALPPRQVAALAADYADVAWETVDPGDRAAMLGSVIDGLVRLPDREDEDALLLARLRDARAHALYELGDVEGARRLAREGIAELEPGPPTRARALLLNRLGWTYWRAGPVEESVPILERAIEEARSSDGDYTLRWATHDLGVALAFLDRHDEAVGLLERSKRAAQQAGDSDLLSRCYINLPAVRLSRGDPPEPLAEIVDEGLRLARRSARRNTIAWLAANLAGLQLDLGHTDAALALQQEAILQARAVSSPHLNNYLRYLVAVHALRGEIDEALHVFDEAEQLKADVEPQVAESVPLTRAWRRWLDGPQDGCDSLRSWAAEHPDLLAPASEVARMLARMALRIADSEALAEAARLHRDSLGRKDAPVSRAKDDWVSGLASGDGAAVERGAAVLEETGYRWMAADAWADAAILAARAGVSSAAQGRAIELYAAMSMHPLLGALPESRWLGPSSAAPSTIKA